MINWIMTFESDVKIISGQMWGWGVSWGLCRLILVGAIEFLIGLENVSLLLG